MGKQNRDGTATTDSTGGRARFGLQLKLLIATSVLILCVSSFFTTQFVIARGARMVQRADKDIDTLSGIFATSAQLGAWARDILSRDEELPPWVQTSEDVILKHRSH